MDLRNQKRYRVFWDESYEAETEEGKTGEKWRYCELRGKHGTVYPWSWDLLGVQVKAGKVAEKARRQYPGWKVIQNADDFMVFKISNSDLEIATKIIKARKKITVSPERLERLKKMSERFSPFRKNASKKAGTEPKA